MDKEEIKNLIFEIIIVFLNLVIIALLVMEIECPEEETTTNEDVAVVEEVINEEVIETENTNIKVDVKGAVVAPGVYEVDSDARINDVIELAGGLKSSASTKYLNLSKKVTDEMVIYVYTTTQVKNMNIVATSQEECNCGTEDISSCAGANVVVSDSSVSDSTTSEVSSGKVSINNGSKEELMTLSGIGESKAEAIIEYRTSNGGFTNLEDIMNVSGIGESAYSKIKDYITL